MVVTWPRTVTWVPRGASFWASATIFFHLLRDVAEVLAVDVAEDVDGGADVVVGDDGPGGAAGGGGDVGEDLAHVGTAAEDGEIEEVVEAGDAVLRGLGVELVAHAADGIDPEIRAGLLGAGERAEDAVGDVLLGEAELGGLGAIDGDVEAGGVVGFVDAEVDGAGDEADAGEEFLGEGVDLLAVGAGELDVDGSGEAEVENLGDDVGGREPEGHVGKVFGHLVADLADDLGGGEFAGLEGDEDVGVGGAGGAGVVVGGIDAAVGQADVVDDVAELMGGDDLAEHALDEVDVAGGLLDAGAGAHADVEVEAAGVDGGEEVFAEEGEEQKREDDEGHDAAHEALVVMEAGGEEVAVVFAEFLEAVFEALLESLAQRVMPQERGA